MNKKNKDNILAEIVKKTKLHFFRSVFMNYHSSSLGLAESMILEVIEYLDRPSINDLVKFLYMSQPNVSYRINILQKKGYITKTKSMEDARITHIVLTDKYFSYKRKKNELTARVLRNVEDKLNKEEREYLYDNLDLVNRELEKELREFLR